MTDPKHANGARPAKQALLDDPVESKLPEQDHEVPTGHRTRREAAAETLETTRTGVAGAALLMDGDPDLDRTSETEAALRRATGKTRP